MSCHKKCSALCYWKSSLLRHGRYTMVEVKAQMQFCWSLLCYLTLTSNTWLRFAKYLKWLHLWRFVCVSSGNHFHICLSEYFCVFLIPVIVFSELVWLPLATRFMTKGRWIVFLQLKESSSLASITVTLVNAWTRPPLKLDIHTILLDPFYHPFFQKHLR